MQQGDKNTKYFYAVTGERRRRNRIDRLVTRGGEDCEGEQEVTKEISEYFYNPFITSNLCNGNDILGGLHRKFTDSMNALLIRPVEDQEIKDALFSINPHKTPGPDSMSPGFFQNFWHIIAQELCSAVRSF